MKKTLQFVLFAFFGVNVSAQCDTTYMSGNYTQSSDIIMNGIYYVDGDFILPSGITIYVESYNTGGCGILEIHAGTITIDGTINGDYAGYSGGTGGAGATAVTSITGHQNALTSCQNKDDAGRIECEGGNGGMTGSGVGAGASGSDGGQGSGPKQQCQGSGDNAGMVGGAGGAGGGAGGSYGGQGSSGGTGGVGSDGYTVTDVSISPAYAVENGSGGNGGGPVSAYGTATGFDIDMGSGGGGAGGGGRSFDPGLSGGNGGAGGGMVKLISTQSIVVSGTISVNGESGASGGNGGSGGATADCCGDGCNDCGERTVSAGAGAGSGAGGGSGGGIYIETAGTLNVTGELYANGGNGGASGVKGYGTGCDYDGGVFCGTQQITSDDGSDGNQGGAGGGGRIKVFCTVCSGSNYSPNVASAAAGAGNGTAQAGTVENICDYTSIEKTFSTEDVRIFPNPVESEIHFAIPEKVLLENIAVVNMLGEVIWVAVNESNNGKIDVSFIGAGMYFIQFNTGHQSVSIPFIKN